MSLTQVTTGGVDENINIDSNTLKVDGTNNRVGIATSSPETKLHVNGDVQSGGSPFGSVPTAVGTYLDPAGAVLVSRASGDVFLGKKQNTGVTSSINADGSASFGSGNTSLFANGAATFKNSILVDINNDPGATPFRVNQNGTETLRLNQNGSAEFDGLVQSGGNPNDGGAVGTKMTSTGVVQATRSSGASAVFMGYTQGTTTPTTRINGDGSATFTGRFDVTNQSSAGDLACQFKNENSDTSRHSSLQFTNAGSVVLNGNSSNSNRVTIDATDGTATFAGDVTALGYAAKVGAGPNAYVFSGYQDANATTLTSSIDRNGKCFFNGNVGIGNSNPAGGASSGADRILNIASGSSGGTSHITFGDGNAVGVIESVNGNGVIGINGAHNVTIGTGGSSTERVRFDSSGNVLIGTTSTGNGTVGIRFNASGQGLFCAQDNPVLICNREGGDGTVISIQNDESQVGTIVVSGSSTAYNTSSDYRLKENVVDLVGAIDRVKQLAPKRFNFIADADRTVDGFLAHEAQIVVPEAVTGEKDGEEMQGIDQAKLVPLLTAALKEAITKIETLEAKVAALEAAA